MNLRDIFREKYEQRIFSITHNEYELTDESKDFNCSFDDVFALKFKSFINKYFRCINGFIGYDYLLLQSTVFDVLYYHIIKDENLAENVNETRKVELGITFSLFINIIYSIKEKYLYFIGCENNKGKLSFEKSILSENGQRQILSIFKKSYEVIGKYCEARNNLVHSTYDIEINNDDEILFKLSQFNLRDEKEVFNNVNISFNITEEEIKNVLNALYILRIEYVSIISDKNNIDTIKVKEKYNTNGVYRIEI